ncbi:MAG: tetratricopeptide repeat protein [Gammaproteobacteria bacterium]|nr:MAG: tetratricopeptide repeat protein [Gammaproteobacteria bacterium]
MTTTVSDVSRAWALLEAGRAAEAEAECERLLARAPALGPALVCRGLAQRARGKDALAALEAASRALPEDAQLHYVLGETLEEHRLLERAAQAFARAAALRPDFAEAHNELGRLLLALGRTEEAIESGRRALALRPDFAAALGNLANANRARGALGAAIEGYRRLTKLEPGLAEAHHHLGSALAEAGEEEAAIASLERALELRPDYPSAVAQLARLLDAAGRGAEALIHYERLLARNRAAPNLHEYGNLLAGLGRYEAAASAFREALAQAPDDARLHSNLSHVLHCLGDLRGSMEHARRAIELDPRLPEAHLHLGNPLFVMNEMHAAGAAYRRGLAVAPDHAGLHVALAMAERALGLLDEAEAGARRALALRPRAADALALLGGLASDRGRFEEGTKLLRQALAIDPQLPEALTGLSAVRRMTLEDAPWREAAERALARSLPVAHAINLHHALGKYHDDVGDYDAAFRHHRDANELARRSRPPYERAVMTQRATRTLAAFDRSALEALRRHGLDSERPVFIVGMPRSGTTLAEQILASHPLVHGAGEQLYWSFASDVEAAAPPAERVATIAGLGREYLATLGKLSAGAARVVDKLPSNFRNLGLIHAALPKARIIHLDRDPLDTCVSIYFQGFTAGHPYAAAFGDLAHYYREYLRLMAHWRATLPPETLLEVRYESLVEEPEAWSRRMLAHVGLPWDPRCLEFHRNERPVLTASRWQVRQPIGRSSVGRWRRYERYLGPLRAALGDA